MDEAVDQETFVPIAFFKKEAYTGSFRGMRYHLQKKEEQLEAVIYPGPYCFEATPEEKKTKSRFPFTKEGREAMIGWLNEQYSLRKEEWDAASHF